MTEWTGVAGRRVVITGGTGGIGLAAAEELGRRGAAVTVVGHSEERAAAAAAQIAEAAPEAPPAEYAVADLRLQTEVRRLAADLQERYRVIDVLVNNAGAMFARRQVTAEGFEATWALNHLAPFLLTALLVDRMKQHPPARIVTTASAAHQPARIPFDDLGAERSYRNRGYARYGETKLANILFTAQLAEFLEGSGVTAYCYHPGLVATGFNMGNGPFMRLTMRAIKPFSRSPEEGADTLVWLADAPEVAGESGGYFVDRQRVLPSAAAQDMGTARHLWELSSRQTSAPRADPRSA